MPKGNLEITIAAAPAKVFAFVADLEGAPDWVPDLVSVTKLTEGPVGVGTQYSEIVKVADKEGAGSLEVTRYEPDRVFAHKGQGGPAKFTATFTVEPSGDGARVVHEYEVKLSGMAKLMSPVLTTWMKKNGEKALANLKSRLEGGAGG